MTRLQRALRAMAAAVIPVVVLVGVLVVRAGISAYGALIALALLGVWASLFMVDRRRRRLLAGGLAALFVLITLRAWSVQTSPVQVRRVRDGVMQKTLLTAFVDERDPAVLAAAFLELMGALPAADRVGMADILDDGYRRLANDIGFVPTVMPVTAVLAQQADDFFVVTVEVPQPRGVVVFLHGSGGAFTLPCWQVAQAAQAAGFSTWCPATSGRAAWASDDGGGQILRRTIELARAHSASGIVVGVGLSAGGMGLTALGDDVDIDLDGVIAISGTAKGARPARHSTLLIHGSSDAMAPIEHAVALGAVDVNASLLRLDGNHFVLLQQHTAIAAAITARLQQTTRASTSSASTGTSP